MCLTGNLFQRFDQGTEKKGLFQQGKIPEHTAQQAKQLFQINRINLFKWLGKFPDFNPIENLWLS